MMFGASAPASNTKLHVRKLGTGLIIVNSKIGILLEACAKLSRPRTTVQLYAKQDSEDVGEKHNVNNVLSASAG